jgi:hypothetical protein
VFSLDFPWLGKCCVLVLLDLYIYFGFPLARLKWSTLLKSVRLPLQSEDGYVSERNSDMKVVNWNHYHLDTPYGRQSDDCHHISLLLLL